MSKKEISVAERSLQFSGLFEVELLVELMLRQWGHPHADDPDFRNDLLETAVEILRAAVAGTSHIEGLKPEKMNLVSAIWCAEVISIDDNQDDEAAVIERRKSWTEAVRRVIPSCFCDPDLLD
jgi:hypothetical protein